MQIGVIPKVNSFSIGITKSEVKQSSMSDNKVVLIAYDGSEHSKYALKWYADQIKKPGDVVLLAHCATYHNLSFGSASLMPGDPHVVSRVIHEEEEQIKATIEKMEHLLKSLNLEGRVVRLSGDPGHAITEAATELKADMIVTGCRGLGQIRRTLMGSVSDYIIHHAHIPVLVCRHDTK